MLLSYAAENKISDADEADIRQKLLLQRICERSL